MAEMTAAQWATLVLQDLGAPTSANNIKTMTDWMAAENPWPPPRNNPLNNGLGSGGGSGLGSYPDLQTAAKFAAQNLSSGNYGYPAVKAALVNDAPEGTFKQAIINSSWAGGHYQGTDYGKGYGVGGAVPASTPGNPDLASLAAMSPADQAAFRAAVADPATAAYFQSLNQGGKTAADKAAVVPPASTTGGAGNMVENIPFLGNVSATSQQATALDTIRADLQSFGFTNDQQNSLLNWAWGEVTSNTDPAQIAVDLLSRPEFTQQYPYFHSVNDSLTKQGQAALSPTQYMQLTQNYLQTAQAAGLPEGMLTNKDMATLIEGNVSPNELSDRVNSAMSYVLSTPAVQQAFNSYFAPFYAQSGVTMGSQPLSLGQMAAIVLNPQTAEPLIQQQITTAQIGGASVTSGVGALDFATASQLAKAGITSQQATNAFQNLAPLSALETPRPGMGGEAAQGTVTADQLATGNLLGNPAAQRQQQTAVEVAKAPFAGGGGYASTNKGAGVGSSSPTGAPGQ